MSFSAVTYNILAQAYVKPERYPNSPKEALAPGPRRQLLLQRLRAQDADIYALQEVEQDAHNAIQEALGAGYQGVHEPRHGFPDGASLFVRRSRFTLVRHQALHFEAHEPGYDQLALLGYLSGEDGPIAVASAHLRWQPNETPKEKHLGRLQLLELLAQARSEYSYRWLLMGDVNALSDSVVLQEAYAQGWELSCRKQRPWDTTNIGGRCRKIDYLLYRPAQLMPHPGTLIKLQKDTPMPSLTEPSDHLAVSVRYQPC